MMVAEMNDHFGGPIVGRAAATDDSGGGQRDQRDGNPAFGRKSSGGLCINVVRLSTSNAEIHSAATSSSRVQIFSVNSDFQVQFSAGVRDRDD